VYLGQDTLELPATTLDAFLAHEAGHVLHRDSLRLSVAAFTALAVCVLVAVLMLSFSLLPFLMVLVPVTVFIRFLLAYYDRHVELQADQGALRLLQKAGYTAESSRSALWDALSLEPEPPASSSLRALLRTLDATHPSRRTRLALLLKS
jgi:Zn-dependent protease with chaperone function